MSERSVTERRKKEKAALQVKAAKAFDMAKIDITVTTDDVVSIAVVKKEKELNARKRAIGNDLSALQAEAKAAEENIGKQIEHSFVQAKREFDAIVDASTRLTGSKLDNSKASYDGNEGNLIASFSANFQDRRSQINLSATQNVTLPVVEARKLKKDINDKITAKSKELSEVMEGLRNLSSTEREARARLAEMKMAGQGLEDIGALLLSE